MSKSKEPIIWQCEHCGAFNNIKNEQCGKCFELQKIIKLL
jgi:ribosomal protein L40E